MDSRALKSNRPLVEALAQLDLGGQSQGAISKLPNEMLRAILGRLQAHHLIPLRLVNKKLKVVVEDILKDKKGLVIMQLTSYHTDTLLEMSKRFNGHVKWNRDFVFIRLRTTSLNKPRTFGFHLSSKLCTLLAKLFPNIEQFFMDGYFSYCSSEIASMLRQWSLTLNTLSLRPGLFVGEHFNDLCAPINDLVNLKRFDMSVLSLEMTAQLGPTFARLEHVSGCTIENVIMSSPNLEAGITSLGMCGFRCVTIGDLTKLNRLVGSFVSSLERLSLYSPNPDVLPFICQHFSSLKVLRFDCDCMLTTDMIKHLARLTHLTELRFESIRIEMTSLDIANLVPLDNIRTFSLVDFYLVTGRQEHHRTLPPNFDVHQFSRVLSTISRNVENLIVKSRSYPMLENVLEPHVNLFVNLRSHDFSLTDPIDRLMD